MCPEQVPFADRAGIEAAAAGPVDQPMLPVPLEFAACDAWGLPPAFDVRGTMPASLVPAIATTGSMDPQAATDVERAVADLPNAVVVTTPGVAGRLGSGATMDCFRTVRSAFLDAPTAAPNADCLEDFVPQFH